MAWTTIIPLYDTNWDPIPGVIDPDTFTDLTAWDAFIDELRVELETTATDMSRGTPDWTRGTGSPKRLVGSGAGENDYFYASHVEDIRDEINYMEADLYWNATTWEFDPIIPKYNTLGDLINEGPPATFTDPRDTKFIEEPRDALDIVRGALLDANSDDGGV